jgi:hypothetical protein
MSDAEHDDMMSVADSQRQLNRQVQQMSHPLSRASRWMKLIAVFAIIGAIWTLVNSWWSSLYIWLPLWTSMLLFQAATHVSKATAAGSKEQLIEALDKLRLYFKISGVLALIGILTLVISLFFIVPHWLSLWGQTI